MPLNNDYIGKMYKHCIGCYNSANLVHQYALLIGIVLSHCLPDIFFPATIQNYIKRAGADNSSSAIVNYCWMSVPWVEHKVKGVKDGRKHLAMFTIFIMTLYDEESSLRVEMAKLLKVGALGELWTNKHSEFVFDWTGQVLNMIQIQASKTSQLETSSAWVLWSLWQPTLSPMDDMVQAISFVWPVRSRNSLQV